MTNAYQQAGVNVEAGYRAVDLMKKHIQKTNRSEVIGGVGAFAGLFDLSNLTKYDQPVLVSGTDGVGTKLKLAFEMDKHDTVGIDLVAMCVNDIVAQGADPLFFLDYIACGKNEPEKIEQIVKGIADGCVEAGSALIGGETAEMPGMYQEGEYDLAGFVVGIANKPNIITGEKVQAGDTIIGLPSSGVHSNGFSLVRKMIADYQLNLSDHIETFGKTLGEELLTPTRIYVEAIAALKREVEIKGISHVTGGGFYENIPRALPAHLGAHIHQGSWEVPAIYPFLQEKSSISTEELFGVFNMGVGMAVIVDKDVAEQALQILSEKGENAAIIGEVVEGSGVVLS
ncbi:phosphoribosylformylglycinamidine cyclo-ligase [Radiobacillus kanasensis]|uniref:phosphoribosylformylglycinamidine cyclo-ligase n=1 Tax=Radiobacillus kanasensis TaxID=2844358 RepID=UPI001E288541|nr:phosphoribosylformylglycinamidine cyclo-ligase [Radiobacillus kanasensis]UFT99913.1 phosphoribosylformylglycinamidine cyclo-ligase [Radiobacillus kanasensis]